MPDIIAFLNTRRSVKPREMGGPGPSPAELDTILTIGARVPDHGKLAPWRFIVFEGDARDRAGALIAQAFARKNPSATPAEIAAEKARSMEAPLVIAVVSVVKPHPKVPPWEQELSAGAITLDGDKVVRNLAYYVAAHASKFVPAGSVRVASTGIPETLPHVAFLTPQKHHVLIVSNTTEQSSTFSIRFSGKDAVATLPAGAVATYVW